MGEVVLATDNEFVKGKEAFRSARQIEVESAPSDERLLAKAVLDRNSRAVIVGTDCYRGPLYEALAHTGALAHAKNSRGAIIARFGIGHDGVDKMLARRNNIVVTNTPGVLDISVAEHTMWLMGNLVRKISSSDASFREGRFLSMTGTEVHGKTLGIVGFGRIGRRVAAMAHFGFGMRVLATDCRPIEELRENGEKVENGSDTFDVLDLFTGDVDLVFRWADIISIHVAANAQTRQFVNADRLGLMKPTAMLINTARGSVLDENALYDALAGGRLAGAALDVFQTEPYEPVTPQKDLRTLRNVVLTPHIGSNTWESNRRMGQACLENIARFFSGRIGEVTTVDAMDSSGGDAVLRDSLHCAAAWRNPDRP